MTYWEVTALRFSKGQIGIMETFMIIFVLFIIIGIGMYFFYKVQFSDIKETGEETCIQTSSQQLLTVLNMPEIKCSIHNRGECIDVLKLIAFKDEPSLKQLSRGICKKGITFVQSYPPLDKQFLEQECTEQEAKSPEYPNNCGTWNLYTPDNIDKASNTQILETPVSLYFPSTQEYRIGKLKLTVYIS